MFPLLRSLLILVLYIAPALACTASQKRHPALIFPSAIPSQTIFPEPTLLDPSNTPILFLPTQTQLSTDSTKPYVTPRTPSPSATPQPYCTVIKNARLRSGPGIDFLHLTTLYEGELLIPFAFAPQGRTEGAWVKVRLANDTERIGWVTGASGVLACNMDITKLPPPGN